MMDVWILFIVFFMAKADARNELKVGVQDVLVVGAAVLWE